VDQGIADDSHQAYAAGGDPLRNRLVDHQRQLAAQLAQMQVLVKSFAEHEVSLQDLALFELTHAQALRSLDKAWAGSLLALNDLLQARVDGLFARMWLHLGTALVLLMGILSLVYAVAGLIARPLKELAGVAQQVSVSGNYNLRARWESHDEIGHLVAAFNGMLGQLDQARQVREELVANARAALAQQALLESIPIAMVVTSVPDHRVLHANSPAQPWLAGQTQDPWKRGLEPGVRVRFFQHLADRGEVDEFEVRWLGGDTPSWAVLSAWRLRFQGVDAVLTTFTPINVIKLMEQRLELWAKVFEASSEGIVIMDEQQRVLSVNRAFSRATLYDHYELVGERLAFLLDAKATPGTEDMPAFITQALQARNEWQGEVWLRRRNGETYPAWLMVSAVREHAREGRVTHYIGLSIDITDRKRTEERVRFLAQHDVLTELPNRALCVQTLDAALRQARVSGEHLAVLFIDLDRFKVVNDTLGHHIGDGLLRSVAQRLKESVRSEDLVSRLGGDEFVAILRHLKDANQARWQAEHRLIPLVRQTHDVLGHALNVSCSVGIALYPQDGSDLDELMRRADAAMYEAKSAGRDAARSFDPSIDAAIRERQQMEQLLRLALERQELALVYQPQFDAKTRAVVGVEALLRWHSAELGAVSPAQFIPVAEESGLILPIGRWVLHEACAQWLRWQGIEGVKARALTLSVNLSAAQLADPELVPDIGRRFASQGCEQARLILEITESHLMADADLAVDLLNRIKALGLQLAVDDFGTGYSSLAYLKRFPIDKLKIDQSFVRDMLEDAADLAIVRATIALGHSLGLSIVAEGVETAEQAHALTSMGCDELQGYHLARPMSAHAVAELLSLPTAQAAGNN
jgi:diguanylate cyclase (GGDEF)-like protein/PAS domain S-box-containing protein